MQNPYPDPLDDKTGFMHELLDALSPEELHQYIAHYQWRQAHEVFPEKPRSMYQSKAYFLLRTNQLFITPNWCSLNTPRSRQMKVR